MLCDKYTEALIEAAASDAALPIPLREHVDACGRCRVKLAAQRSLFTLVDAGLHSRSNIAVPVKFNHRVHAALQRESYPGRSCHSSVFAFGSIVATAALVMAILFAPSPNRTKQDRQSSAAKGESLASQQYSRAGEGKLKMPPPSQTAYSRTSHFSVSRGPKVTVHGRDKMDVLVPQGQEELLAEYMEGIAIRRSRVAFSASLQHEPDMKPVEVSSIQISQVVVKPLPDLSAD